MVPDLSARQPPAAGISAQLLDETDPAGTRTATECGTVCLLDGNDQTRRKELPGEDLQPAGGGRPDPDSDGQNEAGFDHGLHFQARGHQACLRYAGKLGRFIFM